MTQDVAQCDLWKLINCSPQIGDHVLDALVHFLLPIAPEVVTAEILRIEAAFAGDRACQTTSVDGNTHNDHDAVVSAGSKERVFLSLRSNVVDDDNRIHRAATCSSQCIAW